MEVLLSRRRTLKGKITRIQTAVDNHNLEPLCEPDAHYFMQRLDQLTQESDQLLESISELCDDEAHDDQEAVFSELETKMRSLRAKLVEIISQSFSSKPLSSPVDKPASAVRLPKLELPTFSGDYHAWLSFHDLFVATVHNNNSLSGAQKLQYLKASLRGEAALLLQSVQVTDGNYVDSWETLSRRYQNKREIVNSLLDRIVTQPSIQQESAQALRKLVDTTNECIRAIQVMKIPTSEWDPMMVHLITKKLDNDTRRHWEMSLTTDEIASFTELTDFLDQRARALAALSTNKQRTLTSRPPKLDRNQSTAVHHGISNPQSSVCDVCSGNHSIYKCPRLLDLSPTGRAALTKELTLCFNCLRRNHRARTCPGGNCKKCGARHHTLLHFSEPPTRSPVVESTVEVKTLHSSESHQQSQVLLSTALIKVKDKLGEYQLCRALLDSASQASFITERCVQRLGVGRQHTNISVSGLGASGIGNARGVTRLQLSSCIEPEFSIQVTALVLNKVTGDLPTFMCKPCDWVHTQSLRLADPTFYKPGPVDILLGADLYVELMREGRISGPQGTPTAMESVFGWLLLGPTAPHSTRTRVTVHHSTCQVESVLRKFWEIEEVPATRILTPEEETCELHFASTHRRDENGRYVIKLPCRNDTFDFGASRNVAIRRLNQVERRLAVNPIQQKQYRAFLNEYIELGHMEASSNQHVDQQTTSVYYLPHHSVTKDSSTTTKLRVVFDASSKSSSGVSLNDQLLVGPKLQEDLMSIMLRFRTHLVALNADITKMYRQIRVDSSQTDLQRIVWRESPDSPHQDYRLLTVTYGTASAPYLATKCLQQLAYDEQDTFPTAAKVLLRDFYVDDLLSGAQTRQQALTLQAELIALLKRGGFELRKWVSNDPHLLATLPPELRGTTAPLRLDEDESVKTLGILWHPARDHFVFSVVPPRIEKVTKRVLLSSMAKVFDPLGWLSPFTIRAKIIFQKLWKVQISWDELLPEPFQIEWMQYVSELPCIEQINIRRCIISTEATGYELHGFCDASESAYAAVVFLKTLTTAGQSEVNIVAAKTKVAPIKQLSLPRLELCGAVLLSKLMNLVKQSLGMQVNKIYGWTDSTVVMGWLASHPSRWKTFVANRVAEIQEMMPIDHWRHVSSEENPADCASRGISSDQLSAQSLWWRGPSWLSEDFNTIQEREWQNDALVKEEEKRSVHVAHVTVDMTMIFKFSSLVKLQRVTVYCLRFIRNSRKVTSERQSGYLTLGELREALHRWIRCVQVSEFKEEIQCMTAKKPLPTNSRLLCLNPFLDDTGIVRVGGRLEKANLSADQKYPMLLPRKHRFTELIISHYHQTNLHAGPQLLQAAIQRQFWIIGSRDVIRQMIQRCVVCARQRARTAQQMMGTLPAARVNPARAFLQCGIDYAGPYSLRVLKGRGQTSFKGYIALFVCFVTKAIHLELVSDLTTDAFIAALKRFISRRGRCSNLYSDCGTNFVGADRQLKDLAKLTNSDKHQGMVSRYLSNEGINWHFNPPAAPHFGGLWEAGVKSVKFHLRRILSNARLTYEEMYTLMTQVEAVLNSRPLTSMSSDPCDLQALTPGHFLIGEAPTAIPEPEYLDVKMNRLSRWQLIQQLQQHFWRRWTSEYLSRLQQRPKWWSKHGNLRVGDLILLKEDHLPPLKRRLGRILEVHPGSDGCVRVVTVKTAESEVKRPIAKVCPLPIDNDSI